MKGGIVLWLTAALLLACMASLAIGPVAIPLDELTGGNADPAVASILFDIRLPRTLAAAIAGVALGMSGAAMQGLLRNPLAEPGVMGVSASAATAATAVIYFGVAPMAAWAVPMASLGGALLATAFLTVAGLRTRGIATLILIGIALSAFAGAVMALFVNLAPNPFSLSDLINWTAGSVANRDTDDIALALPFILAGCALLLTVRRSLALLVLGEESAHALGVDLMRVRIAVVVGTGLATGGAVALAGMIGFVGLVAPHMVRGFVGHDSGRTLLPSALAGALLLVVGDMIIRVWPWGNELHLGTLAALVGAPLFLMIALRHGTVRNG